MLCAFRFAQLFEAALLVVALSTLTPPAIFEEQPLSAAEDDSSRRKHDRHLIDVVAWVRLASGTPAL